MNNTDGQKIMTVCIHGKVRPINPPSEYSHFVNPSLIPTPPPKPRTTKRTLSSSRNILPDEMNDFLEKDKIMSFEDLCSKIFTNGLEFFVPIVAFRSGNVIFLQSSDMVNEFSGVPGFF